jgi:putative tryptophan/tyrosine transport system substrate-binding protein
MRRRDIITVVGSTAVAWPVAAWAQQPALPTIGYLSPISPEAAAPFVAAFRKGLGETGHIEGRNLTIEYRWGADRLPELAADLIRRRVVLIATPGSTSSTLAAKGLTTTIPVVFSTSTDPVQAGFVTSLNRPGGNLTGIASMGVEIGGKQFGLLRELLPKAARFAVLVNPNFPAVTEPTIKAVQSAASATGRQLDVLTASTIGEIDGVFERLARANIEALVVSPGNLFATRRVQITILATRHRIPTIYPLREYVDVGGLMSYGADAADQHRQAGVYAGRILNGEKPAEMPVMRASKFEFVINLQTARTFGIEVPPTLLAIADGVVE